MSKNNRFVFVACSYNMSYTVGRMLHTILGQSYGNWRIIIIDDVSTKENAEEQSALVELAKSSAKVNISWSIDPEDKDKIRLFTNPTKEWEMKNVLRGISYCDDDDIICRIDADDWLVDADALYILNEFYNESNCDAAWTQHRWGFSDRNISGPLPKGADPYKHPWVSSHLKTFRKRLLNGVPYKNFLNMNEELIKRTGDQGLYLPILHHAKNPQFLPRVMYHYHIDEQNGAVYQTTDAKFQKSEAEFIRARGYVASGETWEKHVHL